MAAWVRLYCERCKQVTSHRVEIIQGPGPWFTKYTCLACELVTEERDVKPGQRTKLDTPGDNDV